MPSPNQTEAEAFYHYLGAAIDNGGRSQSPEDLLTQWRAEADTQATIDAVNEGMADAEAGRMRPLRELLEEAERTGRVPHDL